MIVVLTCGRRRTDTEIIALVFGYEIKQKSIWGPGPRIVDFWE